MPGLISRFAAHRQRCLSRARRLCNVGLGVGPTFPCGAHPIQQRTGDEQRTNPVLLGLMRKKDI